MSELTELAQSHQDRLGRLSDRTARNVVRLWRSVPDGSLDAGWDRIAPALDVVMTEAQVTAAAMATGYAARAATLQKTKTKPSRVVAEAFAGVTRDGRAVVPELFSAVTTTKTLIGRGVGVGAAFQAGTGMMSVIAGTIVKDTGRDAVSTVSVGRGSRFSVRVVQAGACSRCAILAGVKGYREDFQRHPECRCTSMPLYDTDTPPEGFFRHPVDYFDSLSESEQEKVFTKSGAWAIRNGADPAKVVNARRGAYTASIKRADGTFGPSRLRPITIGVRPDGSPLQVYATVEGTTSRGWGRTQVLDVKGVNDRYRRTSTLRLMPEQIMTMAQTPERARELLKRYGYLY